MPSRVSKQSDVHEHAKETSQAGSSPDTTVVHREETDWRSDERQGDDLQGDDDDVVEVPAELLTERPEGPTSFRVLESLYRKTSESTGPDSCSVSQAYSGPPSSLAPPSALTYFDPLRAYLREVQRHPLLTPEQERKLAMQYAETGDVEAAATLVSSNLRLVVKIAYEYRRAYRNMMDLIQEGNIGLMQAVKRYDPCRGVKLSTYAAWWIRAYILRFVLANWRLVKIGTTQNQRKLFYNLSKEKARLASMGIEPTSAEIAKQLDVDESEVVEMDRRLASREASLDAPVGNTSDGRVVSRLETLPSEMRGPDVQLLDEEFFAIASERMKEFRATLRNEKDIAVFDERLMSEEPLTLQEIGVRFGVSRERVRQIEARLLTRLRTYLEEELGDTFSVG